MDQAEIEKVSAEFFATRPHLDPRHTSLEFEPATDDHGCETYRVINHTHITDPAPAIVPAPFVPSIGRHVHYVSHGSPDGTHPSTCRTALITEVGAWIAYPKSVEEYIDPADGTRNRTLSQLWTPDACALEVHNPTGLWFNTCTRDETSRTAGTWHAPQHD